VIEYDRCDVIDVRD